MNTLEQLKDPLAQVGRSYHRVVQSDALRWAQEKQHLLAHLQRNPSLKACTPESLAHALLEAGTMGLSLNPTLGHCYVIPRRARKKQDGESWQKYKAEVPQVAYASPSYMGLAELAYQSGRILSMAAEVVFVGDTFRYYGPMKVPDHEAVIVGSERTWERAVGVYAVAVLGPGSVRAEYMDSQTVERIRKLSEVPNSLMWSPEGLWSEGWKKAVIRRMWKTIPKSPAMVAAQDVLQQHEGIVLEDEKTVLPAPEKPQETISREQKGEIAGLLTSAGVEDVEAWMKRLAIRFGVQAVDALPVEQYPEAKQLIEGSLRDRQKRREDVRKQTDEEK